MNTIIKAFVAGFLSTLTFHQGLLGLLYLSGLLAAAPYSIAATAPLGVPKFLSLAFWGGVWGLPLWWTIRGLNPRKYWLIAAAFGALLPSLVAWFVVFPLKGLPAAGGWKPQAIGTALILNGAWGVGVAFFMRFWGRK